MKKTFRDTMWWASSIGAQIENKKRMLETFKDQLDKARKLIDKKGEEALRNPHALTGQICGCRDCFCCAALQVWREYILKKTGCDSFPII